MKIWLENRIGEAIGDCTAAAERSFGPALSWEADHLPRGHAKEAVISSICEWQQGVLIGFFRVGSGRRERVRACLVDIEELALLVDAAIATEEVVSVLDPAAMGGCTFDFSPDEEPNPDGTVEMLVTARGEHEAMIERLADRLNGMVFRQGKTADEYPKSR